MREKPNDMLERGRVVSGPWGSNISFGNYGMFRVHYPKTGKMVRVLSSTGGGWEHVSVSIERTQRCPTWEEMCWIKDQFWGPEEWVMQYHPAESEYVNYHPYVLHLWKPVEAVFPIPPTVFVGPKKVKRH